MAEIKISQLTAAASANGTMEFETNDSGTSKKVTGDQLKTYATSSLGTISTQNANNVAITGGSITGITDLAVADGGTGASTLTGYVKGSGTAALTASSTIPNTDITGLGTMSTQAASSVAITGGSISGITDLAVADGGTGASTLTGYIKGNGTSAFTASATIPNTDISGLGTMSTQAANSVAITGGSINGTTVGATTASTGAFTTLSASSTVSGTGFSNYLASPPAIGGTAPAAGSFTTLAASSTVSGTGFSNYLASPPAIGGTAAAAGSFTTLNASTLNVTAIKDASGGNTATINGMTPTAESLQGMRNRLINGGFAFDQRNAGASTAIADDTYCFDRWYALTQTASVNVSQQTNQENGTPYNIRLTQNQATAQRMGLAQIIEGSNCRDLRGQSVVLNFRVRASNSQAIRYAILEWTGTEDAVTSDVVNSWTSTTYTAGNFFVTTTTTVTAVGSITPTANTWTSLSTPLTGTIGSSTNNIIVLVWTEGTAAQNFTLDLGRVQLEAGSVATPFERRPYGTELALCQRYFEKVHFTGSGYYNGSNGVVLFVPQLVQKRGTPTVSRTNDNWGSWNVNLSTYNEASDGTAVYLNPTGSAAGFIRASSDVLITSEL